MAIKRPTSGLTPSDLEAGQFVIQGGDQGVVSNVPGMGAPVPRPAGVSDAPRPSFDSAVPAYRPSQASSDLLRRMTAEQKGGGPVSARERRVKAFDVAEAAPAKALAEQQAKEQAFQQQKDLAVAPIKAKVAGEIALAEIQASVDRDTIRSEAKTEADKIVADERIAEADRAVAREALENKTLLNTRDNETKVRVQEMISATDEIEANIKSGGQATPLQSFALDRMKSNTARLVGIEGDIAIAMEEGTDPKTNPELKGLMALRQSVLDGNNDLQRTVATLDEQPASQDPTLANNESGVAPTTVDMDGDGEESPDEIRFNALSERIRRKNELVDGGTFTASQMVQMEEEAKRLRKVITGQE